MDPRSCQLSWFAIRFGAFDKILNNQVATGDEEKILSSLQSHLCAVSDSQPKSQLFKETDF